MSEADGYRRKADALLKRAAEAENMAERGRLIDEALHWHNIAMELTDHPHNRLNDNAGETNDNAGQDDQAASRG